MRRTHDRAENVGLLRQVAAAWCLGAVLSAMQQKEKLLGVPERIAAFNRTCDETLAFMQREIAALRLPPPR